MEIEVMNTVAMNNLHARQGNRVMVNKAPEKTQRIITGFRMKLVEFLIRMEIVWLVIRYFSNPLAWYRIYTSMDPHRKEVLGERKIEKILYVDGKYYWGLFLPGWPSRTFHQFLKAEINRRFPVPVKTNRFTNIFMAITNKCPLACEHCYEWDALNTKNQLTVTELKTIVEKFQEKGVTQIHLSGGEPMARMNDVLEVLNTARKDSEFWILTSGFHLTADKALKLKEAGLTGVMISLDHFNPEAHSAFRGFKDAFYWVEQAVSNAIAAKLVTALTICVTRSFVSEPNLMQYMELAKRMGVAFVQILEPRATGHYKNQDVALTKEHETILDTFYLKMNYNAAFRDFPLLCYHGFHQRRMGCWAAGDRSLYVDTVGDIHACPFCHKKTGNVLSDDLDNAVCQLQSMGCHKF
jgi:MoaA/NifB/PqqE/SkfB family radical SAM enzyme